MVFKSIPSYLKRLVIMSKTNIYKIMEVTGNLLFQGSDAALNGLLADNGVSFQEALSGKGSGNSSHGITESLLYGKNRSSYKRCSIKKLKNFAIFTGNTCEYCKIFKNTYFQEHLSTIASVKSTLLVSEADIQSCFKKYLLEK